MMPLTDKDVRHVAELAHLDLTDAEVSSLRPQLSSILDYVQKLNQLDTSGVEPMAQVLEQAAPQAQMRVDQTVPSLPQDAALASAPEAGAGCFKVPSVIERD